MSKMSVIFDRFFEKKQYQFWILFITSSVLLFSSLRKGGLSGYDDAFYAHYGEQMILTGDWWSLRLNGYHIFEFPPMFPWLEALSMKVFGITDFAAKVPAALSGLLTTVLTYLVAKELFISAWAPILSMAIMSGSQIFIKYSMHSMTDAPFTCFFTLALYLYLKGLKKPGYFFLSGVAIGTAVLTRSVLGLIPLGVIFLHIIVTGRYKLIWSKYFIGAVVLSIAIPIVWYGSQYNLYGRQFLNEHFSFVASKILGQGAVVRDDLRPREVILCRTIGGQDLTITTPTEAPSRSEEGRGFSQIILGFVEYPKLLIRHYWPWLPLMLIGLLGQVRDFIRSRDSGAALLVIWVTCVLIPFSVAEAKALRYILPVFPAFAILAAAPLSRWVAYARSGVYVKLGYLIVLMALLLAALFPKPRLRAEDMQALAPIIDANSNSAQRVILYTFGELKHNYKSQFVWYTDQYCVHLTELNTVRDALISCPGLIAVIDKQAFSQMSSSLGANIRALGESENFVCIKSKGL
jgi:4-amino-4-deoxy-L-arabinose transferase-like glycosyltransferase